MTPLCTHSLTLVGAGNIGSHLVPHLGRLPKLRRLTLIDSDIYQSSNLVGQDIGRSDIGRRKVSVQARRLRRIRPGLELEVIFARVETVPLGRLRSDVILGCLDSRVTRQWLNEAALHLGLPWIDAGVNGAALQARVSVFAKPGDACLECGWNQADYDALERRYPCAGDLVVAATHAPSSLGAVAAAMQATACVALLENGGAGCSYQVFLDLRAHAYFKTNLQRNPECRLVDHQPWRIASACGPATELTLADLFALGDDDGVCVGRVLRADRPFVRQLRCTTCARMRETVHLQDTRRAVSCRHCGSAMVAGALDLEAELAAASLEPRQLARTLRQVGLRDGDVVAVQVGHDMRYLEIGSDPRPVVGPDHKAAVVIDGEVREQRLVTDGVGSESL